MKKTILWILVTLRIVKTIGKDDDGNYMTAGLRRKNPLSYLIAFGILIYLLPVQLGDTVKYMWKRIFEIKD